MNRKLDLFYGNNDVVRTVWDLRDITWTKSVGSVASDGVFVKSTLALADTVYLKMSNYDSYRGVFGHEAVNELVAARLGVVLGFSVPPCVLRKARVCVDGKEFETYLSVVKSFKGTGSRQSFDKFYNKSRLSADESPLDFCRRHGWAEDVYKMFIFDYLIMNRDRHGANLEVLKSGNEFRLSPFFDNGASFVFSYTDGADLRNFDVLADLPVNNFIGMRSLKRNLEFIDRRLHFNELTVQNKQDLCGGLDGILPTEYCEMIWEILWRRWENVKEFRVT